MSGAGKNPKHQIAEQGSGHEFTILQRRHGSPEGHISIAPTRMRFALMPGSAFAGLGVLRSAIGDVDGQTT